MVKFFKRVVGPRWPVHIGNVVSSCIFLAVMWFGEAPIWLLLTMAALAGACVCNLAGMIAVRRDIASEGWLDELDARINDKW